jgi:hypothetical protein
LVKCAGAIYLPHSTITVLDESEAIKKSGSKKLKYAFLLESKFSDHPYFLCSDSEETRKVLLDLTFQKTQQQEQTQEHEQQEQERAEEIRILGLG